MSEARLLQGDALTVLKTLPDASVRCCVTSPPYWGLRDYGMPGQLGLEATPEEYVARMVEVFREVRRVLADDGTLWCNLGDSYAGSGRGGGGSFDAERPGWETIKGKRDAKRWGGGNLPATGDCKPKDLVGIPWMVAFALRADGWYLRSDIIWAKPNPMPESVTDRPTKSHEYLFLLAKQERYYYDADAIMEPLTTDPKENYPARAKVTGRGSQGSAFARGNDQDKSGGFPPRKSGNKVRRGGEAVGLAPGGLGRSIPWEDDGGGRNARSVWTIATMPYKGAHFATFPEELARRCLLAGSAPGDTCLDPFGGSGTVAQVATGNARNAVLIELNPAYLLLARQRIGPLLCEGA